MDCLAFLDYLAQYAAQMNEEVEIESGGAILVRVELGEPPRRLPALLDTGFSDYLVLPEDVADHVASRFDPVAIREVVERPGEGPPLCAAIWRAKLRLPTWSAAHDVEALVLRGNPRKVHQSRQILLGLRALGNRFSLHRNGTVVILEGATCPLPEE